MLFILAWFLFTRFGYSFGSVPSYISGGAVSGGLRIFMFLANGMLGVMDSVNTPYDLQTRI